MEAYTAFRSYTPSNFVLDWKSRGKQEEQPATIPTNFTPKFRMDLLFPCALHRILFSSIDDPELVPEAEPMSDRVTAAVVADAGREALGPV
jgi:hypothetical protein